MSVNEEQIFDRYTEIDDLMRQSVQELKKSLTIIDTTNRNIYDILQGNLIQSGLIAYEQNQPIMPTLDERKKAAKQRLILTDYRDKKSFIVRQTIIDEYAKNILATTRFVVGDYFQYLNTGFPSINQIGGYYFNNTSGFFGSSIAISNIKMIGYGNLYGLASNGVRMIFIAQKLNTPQTIGTPLSTFKSFDNSIFTPSHGYSVGNEDVIEFDLSKNPIILRSDLSDLFFFDYENLSGAENHFRLAYTAHLLEEVS